MVTRSQKRSKDGIVKDGKRLVTGYKIQMSSNKF